MAAAPIPTLFKTAKAFESWLEKHGATSDGLWLQIAKAGAPTASVTYAEAIDVALCHGWIDGQKKPLDEHWWLQRFTPRRAKSVWSQINVGKAQALIASDRMRPAGHAQIAAAQADGRWDQAYAGAKTATVPEDLKAALAADAAAQAFFETLDRGNRYAVLWRVQTALKPETRAKRIAQFVAMLARGEKPHA